ncbi:N-glycosylation protein-domain-containing protein [Podospora appendiculata]|uniref:N-glycosylation protein-domain-containing protein n=1 Tax=Podospora appendiculata TaxID=314037 RepID=A0AAE0XLB1_9PEZI|nr:N-glycosylation protein-domain-containing protein [Podospora appendiculata]
MSSNRARAQAGRVNSSSNTPNDYSSSNIQAFTSTSSGVVDRRPRLDDVATPTPSTIPTTARSRSSRSTRRKPVDNHNHSSSDGGAPLEVTAHSSLLQPRVAVVLGLSRRWHPLLFLCRLLSITPAIWWGLPSAIRLLAMLHLLVFGRRLGGGPPQSTTAPTSFSSMSFESRLQLTETLLATIWCGASGYLSFFFTDCLMSRWLLNYAPQATLVRLLTINAINGYITSWVLYLTGGSDDPRLLLPAWILITTTLTVIYHATQRKINIRKETSMSISVFSIASFISMVILLAQLHSNRSEYPSIPIVTVARRAWHELVKVALKIMEYGNVTRDF